MASSTPRNFGRSTAGDRVVTGGRTLMLILATVGFALNFWAWALLSPLAPRFRDELGLNSVQESLVVAVPVIVGSLGRIPIGALADRYGGRLMFPVVSLITVVPVLFLGLVGHSALAALLIGGFFLGVAGTVFAVGVPFVSAWFPPEKQGLAIGVYGMGMGGTAISALTTVRLVDAVDTATPFLLCAAALVIYAIVAWYLLRDAPGRTPSAESITARLNETVRLPVTWAASALYAVSFGGFVAFSVYLPSYLRTAYDLSQTDAANRMAGFVLLAVIMRPVGGWLADRFDAPTVLATTLCVVVIAASVQAATPDLAPIGTIAFLALAAALGAGSGATFALVALIAPPGKVGAVTGFVGAAGGLGGFVPPLVMGTIYEATEDYGPGLLALAVVALVALLFTVIVVRRQVDQNQT
ncbi:nitrate/nitrite transporter [Nocardia jinanensis]|uniref:MFS transporter n=1 Tax=Nocardia jinanensis TaxID=382504 RepID=A0A917RRS0_9NOCA|nr:NarK/NasA family nitrate transporter [Nocardia jinanensis]GGL21131.1 MFS transporter [Nocardia jinanensis]